MARHNELGKLGEEAAKQYLLSQGYAILQTNFRVGRKEADIIAYQDGVIVFVEVKTRSSDEIVAPESAVDRSKQQSYVRLANAYVLQNHREEEVRFDIIAILVNDMDDVKIKHIPNAFTTIG